MFWPVLEHDFVRWDDDISVLHNPMLREPWSWELVKSFFDPQAVLRFKPLHSLVMRVVSDFAGLNAARWHAVGLVFHAFATAAVFMAMGKALKRADISRDDAVVAGVAWMAAAIWALHPLRVEPVAWVTGSSYPMTMFFLAWSYWAYLKAHETGEEGGVPGAWLGVSWVLAVGAYATYPISVTYVAWLMATDGFLLRRVPSRPWRIDQADTRKWWLKHVLFVVPALLSVGATLWTRLWAPAGWHVAPTLGDLSWAERMASAAATLMIFPFKLLWPVELTPNHAHTAQSAWTLTWVWVGAAAFLGAAVALWMLRRRRYAWIWYCAGAAGFALPCLGLTERPVWPVDRYSYALDAILIGGLAAGLLGVSARTKHRRWVGGVLALALVAAVLASRSQIPVWRNTHALFADMERHPDFGNSIVQKAHVYLLWHVQFMSEGRTAEARAKLAMANETYLEALRGALRRGDLERAVFLSYVFEDKIGITPEIRRERAGWLLKLGRRSEAETQLKKAALDLPGDARLRQMQAELGEGSTLR